MRRRDLLQGLLGIPMVATVDARSKGMTGSETAARAGALVSGLAGFDHAVGGVAAGELVCVTSPPWSGKTVLLLDWAARICRRYAKNVVFYSANEPSFGIARKAIAKGRAPGFFTGDIRNQLSYDREIGSSGAILMHDSESGNLYQAQTLARWLKANHPAGCAALILDGWCTTPQRPLCNEGIDGVVAIPAACWTPTRLSVKEMSRILEFAHASGIPVVMGVQTASLVDDEALASSSHVVSQLWMIADRWVSMYRPELYVETEMRVNADQNAASLLGSSHKSRDARHTKLRFDRALRRFETVV